MELQTNMWYKVPMRSNIDQLRSLLDDMAEQAKTLSKLDPSWKKRAALLDDLRTGLVYASLLPNNQEGT